MPIARSTYAGVATGAVLLAGAVGFGVGLPKVVDDPGTTAQVPALPDRLDDRFTALQSITPEQGGATTPEQVEQMKTFTERSAKSEKTSRAALVEEYGDASVRAYLDVPSATNPTGTTPAQIAVTVVPGSAGLLNSSGPFQVDEPGAHYTLEKIDGNRCAVAWNDPVDPATGAPTGQEPTGADYRVQCRTEREGLTYDLYTTGLTPDEVAHYVDLVLEKTAG